MATLTSPNVADPELGGSEPSKEVVLRKENEHLRKELDDLKEASRNKSPYETHETVIKPRRSALNAATPLHTSASLFPTATSSSFLAYVSAAAPCFPPRHMRTVQEGEKYVAAFATTLIELLNEFFDGKTLSSPIDLQAAVISPNTDHPARPIGHARDAA